MDKIEITDEMVQDAIRCVENSLKVEVIRSVVRTGDTYSLRALQNCEPLKYSDALRGALQEEFDELKQSAKSAELRPEDVPHVLAYAIEGLAGDGFLDAYADEVFSGGFDMLVELALKENTICEDAFSRFQREGAYEFSKDDGILGVSVHTVKHGEIQFGETGREAQTHQKERLNEAGERASAASAEIGLNGRGGQEVSVEH